MHQCWTYDRLNSGIFNQVADWALQNNMPIFIHLKSKNDVLDFIQQIKQRPENVFIVAHLIGIEEFIKHKNILGNIHFDISCPQIIPLGKLNFALQHFGAEKLLFGSDTPYGKDNSKANIQRIRNLDITQAEKDDILGNNIIKLLGI
jgi:Predicted metal-dependent hydrolase of the TIM-barrel fold